MGKRFGIVGVIITSQATVDGLSEQRDEVVSDVATGAALLEIVAGDMGKAQDIIQFSNGQESAVRQLMIAAGIKDIRRAVHSLRHTVGADLRKRGADIRDIQDVLRHANISTTQIYTQMAKEELRKKLPRRFLGHRQLMFSHDDL